MIELREDQEESVCKEPQVTYFCGCGAEERLSGDHGSSGFGDPVRHPFYIDPCITQLLRHAMVWSVRREPVYLYCPVSELETTCHAATATCHGAPAICDASVKLLCTKITFRRN